MASIHDIKVEGIDGKELNFADFKGKKILVVNVASECGFTPQYQQLEELYKEFKDKLVVVGCPSNDFGGQEPGTNLEIRSFCSLNYGATFPMAGKLSISESPLYQWLTRKALNGVMDGEVKWNFHKFLLDEAGQLVKEYPSSVSPIDTKIVDWLRS